MKNHFISVVFILILFSQVSAQTQIGLPSLLTPTGSEMQAMGWTSVATPTYDPNAMIMNPAQLGFQARDLYLNAMRSYADLYPSFKLDMNTTTYAVNAGVNLNKPGETSMNLGIGYSRVKLHYGDFVITNSSGPEPLGTFSKDDITDALHAGLSFKTFVNIAVGATYKQVSYQLNGAGLTDPQKVYTTKLFDWGVMAELPVMNIINQSLYKPLNLFEYYRPFANISFGYAVSNLGEDSINYTSSSYKDMLPRQVKTGAGFIVGFERHISGMQWTPLSFRWAMEANDMLVKKNNLNKYEYKTGFGDIDFMKDVVNGKCNPLVAQMKGWELNILEVVSLYGGRYEKSVNNDIVRFSSTGYGIHFTGLLKLLHVFFPDLLKKDFIGGLLKTIDLRYNFSEMTTDLPSNPMNSTKFSSIGISIHH